MFGQTNSLMGYQMFPTGQTLNKVNGIESARMFQTLPNSQVVLFDANEDIFYLKTTDSANYATIRKFSFKEITENPNENGQYVTIEEFNKFKEELLNGKQHIRKQSNGKFKQHRADKNYDEYGEGIDESKPGNADSFSSKPSI